jgi:hypothetical protein
LVAASDLFHLVVFPHWLRVPSPVPKTINSLIAM